MGGILPGARCMLNAMHGRACMALAAALLVSGCTGTLVTFPSATPAVPFTIAAHEWRPAGAGPFPAVVLLHGCEGVSSSTRSWARWLRERGWVALVVDSWGSRAIRDGCRPGPELPNTVRFDDAVGALRWLHGQPYVDRERVGVVGWSNGGVFAIALVNGPSLARARARGVEVPAPGFRAAVAFYPGGCWSLTHERVERPLLVLMGDADDWTVPGPCVEMVEAMRGRGADAGIVLYPGAVHYFDVEEQPPAVLAEVENRNRPGGCCGARVGYDGPAAADARRRVAEFFGHHLGGG